MQAVRIARACSDTSILNTPRAESLPSEPCAAAAFSQSTTDIHPMAAINKNKAANTRSMVGAVTEALTRTPDPPGVARP